LSRNNAADGTDSDGLISSQQKLAEDYFLRCSWAQTAAITYKLGTSVSCQALAASTQSNAFNSQLQSLEPSKCLDIVKKRVTLEPRSPTTMYNTIFITPVLLEYAEEFGLVMFTPPKSKDTQKYNVTPSPSLSHLSSMAASTSTTSEPLDMLSKNLSKNPLYLSPYRFKHDLYPPNSRMSYIVRPRCIVAIQRFRR